MSGNTIQPFNPKNSQASPAFQPTYAKWLSNVLLIIASTVIVGGIAVSIGGSPLSSLKVAGLISNVKDVLSWGIAGGSILVGGTVLSYGIHRYIQVKKEENQYKTSPSIPQQPTPASQIQQPASKGTPLSPAQRAPLARNNAFFSDALEEQTRAIEANNREAAAGHNTPPREEQSQTVSRPTEQRAPLFRNDTVEDFFNRSSEFALNYNDREFIRHHIEYLHRTFSKDQAYVFFASTNLYILVEKDPQHRITVKTSKTREILLPEIGRLKAARARHTNFIFEGIRTSLRVIEV